MAATMTQTQLDHPPHLNLKPTTSKAPPSTQPATRIIYIGLLANLSLALIKYTFGHILSSKSLIADAWHSFSDLSTDFSALFALFLTSFLRKRDVDGKSVERHISVLASGILMATAVHVGWESVESLTVNGPWSGNAIKTEDLYEVAAPSVQAIWPALLTILVKEWLYRECEFPLFTPTP
jgi:divalent metal cation (Fe/Co/Zn/Cd) transporter